MASAEELFRRLTIGDQTLLATIALRDDGGGVVTRLDERTEALIRIGALVALDATQSSYHAAVEDALLAGASLDDLLAVLVAIAGSVGSTRIVSAAPRIALAAGYDVEVALEQPEGSRR